MNHKTIVKHLENVTSPEIVYLFSGNYNLADFIPQRPYPTLILSTNFPPPCPQLKSLYYTFNFLLSL